MIRSFSGKRIVAATAVLLGLALMVQSSSAGLGLGEARVASFLGQALDVRIALLQPSRDALDSLTVEVASAEDHARLGVPTDALALGLRVDLDRTVDPPVLHLRSNRPASDPFVQVLVSARWASGRMLREYTLFLDPPTVPVAPPVRRLEPAEPAVPVPEREVAERPSSPAAAPPPTPVRPIEERPRVEPEPAPARRQPVGQRVGPVRAGQTLWAIAEEWRPDASLTMNQVMLAIFENNPQAFMGNNVNRLRQGVELLMPDVEAVRAIAPDDAVRRMRAHNESWRAASTDVAVPTIVETVPVGTDRPGPDDPEPARVAETTVPEPEPEAPVADADDAAGEAPAEDERVTTEPAPEPRLELTTADEALMVDAQALGAQRDRLEEQLDSMVGALRADGLETDAIAADIDEIRQAIESADAGGLMLASEGLAQLEQQVRELRLERERLTVEAETSPAPQPAELPPAQVAETRDWRQPLLAALAVLAVLILVLVVLMRRRASQMAQDEEPVETPVAAAAEPVAPAPAPVALTLDDRLAALRRMAEQEDEEGFSSAFSAFYGELPDTDDPRWKEAVVLARMLVPGHPLLVSPTDEDDSAVPRPGRDERDDRDLMALLEDEREIAPDANGMPDPRSELTDLLDEQDADEEHTDLARLANRLDPEEVIEPDVDRVSLDPEESEAMFTRQEKPKPNWEREADDEPLSLDFEFSSRQEVPDEVTQVSSDDDQPTAEAETPAAADKTPDPLPDPETGLAVDPMPETTPQERGSAQEDGSDQVEPALTSNLEAEPELVLPQDEFFSTEPKPDAERPDDEGLSADEAPTVEAVPNEDDDWFKLGPAEDEELPSLSMEETESAESAGLSDDDVEVKLDLARAYLSMDDADSARALLEEIVAEGSGPQRDQARRLLDDLK